jgi:hypothetical protein
MAHIESNSGARRMSERPANFGRGGRFTDRAQVKSAAHDKIFNRDMRDYY